MKSHSENPKSSGPVLLIPAGAPAAAQGLVRLALRTKLLSFAGAASLLVGQFGRKGRTATRPAAGDSHPTAVYPLSTLYLPSGSEPADSTPTACRQHADSSPTAR